jgi:hypothetical protein
MRSASDRLIALPIILVFIGLCACTPPLTETKPVSPASAWGPVLTLAKAEHSAAPAIAPLTSDTLTAWITYDRGGVRQQMGRIRDGQVDSSADLILPPVHPFAQTLVPAVDDRVHLLWLDADKDGETRLYAAWINSALQMLRGPTLISNQRTTRYAALPSEASSLWLVTSGGLAAEPHLYAYYLDSVGRPRVQGDLPIASDADWPTWVRAGDGRAFLFWLGHADGRLFRAEWVNERLTNATSVSAGLPLARGDWLMSLSAGLDQERAYVFWNLSRADGTAETWFSSGGLNDTQWPPAARLGAALKSGVVFETGFNGGSAQAAQNGDEWVSWAAPLFGQNTVMAVAALFKEQVVVIYLRAGEVVGIQPIIGVNRLLRAPNLASDRDRHLYITWSEPMLDGYAALKLTTTRQPGR